MAVEKAILKNTRGETVVKVYGSDGTGTISLSTDLPNAEQSASGTQVVNITGVNFFGLSASIIHVKRGLTTIFSYQGGGENHFSAINGFVDTIENTEDITVEISGGEAQIYIALRKASGYVPFVESAQFGAHDDTTKAGE